ncbi:hypothetical protein PIB30_078766 [Stylosanthes scabra]|uniref:Uncharacterized protein n=1 Tax=Stylosanthes scabra TaxID=79078 RepID=A0ABU6VSW3_9FABA|nr:hypothetical protein [Stylosanthes scabra]
MALTSMIWNSSKPSKYDGFKPPIRMMPIVHPNPPLSLLSPPPRLIGGAPPTRAFPAPSARRHHSSLPLARKLRRGVARLSLSSPQFVPCRLAARRRSSTSPPHRRSTPPPCLSPSSLLSTASPFLLAVV